MRPLQKILLLLEVVICFGPSFLILAMGLIVIPVAISSLIEGQFSGLYLLAMLLGGGFGMAALLSLVIKVMEPDSHVLSPAKIRVFMAMGVVAIVGFLFMVSEGGASWQMIALCLPILSSLHLLYLGRQYVFSSNC